MFNKLYENIKNFIKNNYVGIIIIVFTYLLFNIELNYEIYTPGGLIDLNDRIEVTGETDSKGSINLTYVGAKKGIIPMVLLSYIIDDWDLVSKDEVKIANEDYEEVLSRGKIDLETVNQNALIVALDNANIEYKIKSSELVIYYVMEDAITTLKTGDKLISINDEKITNTVELKSVIDKYNEGDILNIKVDRNGKERTETGTLQVVDDTKVIGVYISPVVEVETEKEIKFKYNSNEFGSSGGLMTALEIYNNLTDGDITKGKTIAGTGAITMDGIVEEISGVKYKLLGASKKHADVFIVPTNNYKEAKEVKQKYELDIKLIEAKTFTQVLEELKNI